MNDKMGQTSPIYESPRITTYGSLAELTAFHEVGGALPHGQSTMSLSVVVAPPGGGGGGGGGGIDTGGGGGGGGIDTGPATPVDVASPVATNVPSPSGELVASSALTGSSGVPTAVSPSADVASGVMPVGEHGLGAESDVSPALLASTPSGSEGLAGGALPFTGAEAGLFGAIGAGLATLGVALRGAVRRVR